MAVVQTLSLLRPPTSLFFTSASKVVGVDLAVYLLRKGFEHSHDLPWSYTNVSKQELLHGRSPKEREGVLMSLDHPFFLHAGGVQTEPWHPRQTGRDGLTKPSEKEDLLELLQVLQGLIG